MKKFFTFFIVALAAISMTAEDYYVTGNDALLGKEKAWSPSAIKLTEGTHTFANVGVETGECQLKVTNGTWDKNWGFSDLDTEKSSEGIYGNGDNNICFKATATCDVVVSFDGTKVTVTGIFGSAPVLEDQTVYYVNSTSWANVYMHGWGGEATGTDWNNCPAGVKESYQLQGFDVYSFTQKGVYGKCLFKADAGNTTNKTVDLDYEAGMYYYNGAWKTREELEQEGPGPGPGPEPEDVTYYIKNNWNAGAWNWEKMTANADKTEWTYTNVFGGTGVNINTESSDAGATWFALADISGDAIAAGDSVTFTYNVEAKTVSAVKLSEGDPTPGPGPEPTDVTYYIKNGWNGGDWTWEEMTPNEEKTEWTYTNVFGGAGVNINTEAVDGGTWYPVADILGDEIAAGDSVTFTYNVEAKTVSAVKLSEGDPTPGPGPEPDAVYYIKSKWAVDAQDWTWEEMTPNADKTEWTFTGDYYGSGVNINTVADDAGASWYSADSKILGDVIVEGDNVTFTYNVAAQTVTAKKNTGTNILNLLNSNETAKRMINGQLFIIREGKMFNVNGILVK